MLRATLLSLSLVLVLWLLVLWVDRTGQLRGIHWSRPAPTVLDVGGMAPSLPMRVVQQGQFLETLERPLFSPSRRPPPPPPPPAPPQEAVSPLTDVRVYGIYGSGNQGGAILGVDGKNQRVAINETVKGWRLVAIGENNLTLRRGSRQQVLELVHYLPAGSAMAAGSAPTPTTQTGTLPSTRAAARAAARAARRAQAQSNPETGQAAQ